jgi:hypothetical protein
MQEPEEMNKSSDSILELQLGDVIKISNPLNDELNDQTFIIDYIDNSKTYLINVETMNRIRVSISPNGIMGDGNITRIAILSRSDTGSYAKQNDLLSGKWINIHFGGDYPVILIGEITNLENDMIEVKTIDGDMIYINFDYKGIPEDLPIELIEIREKPSDRLEVEVEVEDDLPELEVEKILVNPEKMQINIPIKDIIKEFIVKADQVQFGDEVFGPIVQYVDVGTKIQRYSIETQVGDLLDELLSTIPNAQRTPKVLNNIHIMIERFKQLRTNFSSFDQYGNVKGIVTKEASYKPLSEYFSKFKINLYWILPVVKNIKNIYDANHIEDENNDVTNLTLDMNIREMKEILENYKSNDLPSEQNKYSELYKELTPYFTPFKMIPDEETSNIITQKETNENIHTIIDNLEEMYSSIYNNNAVRNRRFVIQKYNTSLTKLNTIESTNAKLITVRTNISPNDIMSIKSIITLPEPVMRFSKINLPGTSILDKANLNLSFLNYWQLLKKKTNTNTNFIDTFKNEIEFNEQNFANGIKNFVLNLSYEEKQGMQLDEIYSNFINTIIPKTKILFNLMKKYINGKLSIVDVVSYLEPFLIYSDDLTYTQYKIILEFISEKISEFNKNYILRSRIFKNIYQSIIGRQQNSSKSFSIINILNKNLQTEVINDGYDMHNPESIFTNSEILRKITLRDSAKLYSTSLSVQSFPLMFPNELTTLFTEEQHNINDKLNKETNTDKCQTITIAKYYTSLDNLNDDNDKTIYFDKKYDKTNYGLLETTYAKELLTMTPDELRVYIVNNLVQKKQFTQTDAEYQADTLVDGNKKVIEGQFAILYKGYQENASDEVDFYVRKNNKWIFDEEVNKRDINTDESSILCDMQQQCINVQSNIDDKCESLKANELGLQAQILKNMISEFDIKYKMTKEEFQKKVLEEFTYLKNTIPILIKIETTNLLKYNNQKYKLGISSQEHDINQISPFQQILGLILSQSDFAKKQNDIVKFKNAYTRSFTTKLESENWLYCIQTNVPILPIFKFELAKVFIEKGEYGYIEQLKFVKSKNGKLSDDGDLWTDKYSGWTICPVDFDFEEGYEAGFKIVTRNIMEEDAGNKIISSLAEKAVKYSTPDTKMINNIVNTLSIAMGINIENQKEFIINSVLYSISTTVESENDFKQRVRIMAEKGKKHIGYVDFYNTAILYYAFGMFLIAAQTSIPSIKTRKTHPGCVRSFTGYPFEGTGDDSSLIYLGCVAYDIRESGEPWNVLKGKKQEIIINKIKSVINDVLLELPEVKRKMEEKTEYLLTTPTTEIPSEHDIAKWTQFLPPLMNFKIKHLTNISPEFKKSLMSDLRSGSINQRDKLLVIESKIIQFSLALIERIQEVVKKKNLLLHSSNNEPYLENACCESGEGETTISYFTKRDDRIEQYNEIVVQLTNIMEDIISYSSAGQFYSNLNTKNKYPTINTTFNEKTIYLSFIYFCKFKSLIPIPVSLLPLCTDKPEDTIFNPNDSIDMIIQKLKNDGRNYTNEQLLRVLQVISQNNIVNINLENPEISTITQLLKLLESIDNEDDEVVEKSLRNLIIKALDSFDIATENYTKEIKDLNNYLMKNIESMREDIIDFIKSNQGSKIANKTITKMIETINNLSTWSSDLSLKNTNINKISDDKLYNIINFYKNFIDNFVNIFPNIIINKVNYGNVNIPKYYGFSMNHSGKLKKNIGNYFEKLKTFYDIQSLQNIIARIQQTCKNVYLLSKYTPSFTSMKINEDKILKPVFDETTSRFIFEYYLLRVLINFIDLSDDDEMIVSSMDDAEVEYMEDRERRIVRQKDATLLTGNKKELRQKTAELLIVFMEILNNEKKLINVSYEDIHDRVFKLREREKDLITDRLKHMTDEERDVDRILQSNKLGMWGKGLQKGLTTFDGEYYDKEQDLRDDQLQTERNIMRTNSDANEDNIDSLIDDFLEESQNDREISDEVNDMSYMNENYYEGRTDGVEDPEDEYDDFADNY